MLNFTQPLVYVVDADYEPTGLLYQTLQQEYADGCIRHFPDGAQLLTQLTFRLDGRLPDLLVVDWDTPLLSGVELLPLLQTDEAWARIPLVLRTTLDNEQVKACQLKRPWHFLIQADTQPQIAQSIHTIRYTCRSIGSPNLVAPALGKGTTPSKRVGVPRVEVPVRRSRVNQVLW